MDIEGGVKSGANLITYPKHGGPNQLWSIKSDGTIVSVNGSYAVDINDANYFAGNHLISYQKHGRSNQQFIFQYQ